jgi:putative colanic acid biosynthesis acetyltransferase WcaF
MQDKTRPLLTAKITIGEWAFLGARTFVLPGVTIGNNCVVGACSVVSKDLPDDCYAIGSPATVRRAKPPL